MPVWAESCIWWHVYPLGFCGAPIRPPADVPDGADWRPSGEPRLLRLLPWLDHAVELGVNGVLLGPVFDSWTHGYDTLDHYRVDPRLGSEADLDVLVAACHARGLRVGLDGVFNHVGDRHPRFRQAAAEGFAGATADLFAIDRSDPGHPRPRDFEGHGSLVALDHMAPAVADLVTDVMRHWLDRGVDAWRLDAAYAVDPAFWARVLPRVREHHPDAWFLGEMIHGDYAGYVTASGIDSVTQYELWKAIWSSIRDRNFFELDWALVRHAEFLQRFTPATFVGNHDVTRIASTVGADGAVVALAVLMTVGGIPSIYSGDEHGFTGVKEDRLGGDDDVRPAFPASPAGLSDGSTATYRAHQDLIGLRRRHPWLTTATTAAVTLTNARYVYRSTAADGSASLLVDLDLTDAARVHITDDTGAQLWSWSVSP